MKYCLVILFLSLSLPFCFSQDVLSLEDAKMLTLENNFGIRISKNNVKVAENLTDRKLNGYLPTVSFGAGLNATFGGGNQQFSNGLEAGTSNALNWGGNASVQANYTVLDKQRDLTLEQLKEGLALTNLQLRQSIEQSLIAVYNAYYQLALQKENVSALEETIDVSRERFRRAKYQLEYGQGNGLNVLNAEVDIKRDSVNLLNALLSIDNGKRNLNIAMGRNSTADFEIEALSDINTALSLNTLLETARENNVNLQINRQNLMVNEMDLNIIEAEKKPTLSAGASYGFNYANNAAGSFIDESTSQGLTGNVTLAWTLYDPTRDIRKENTVLSLTNLKLEAEQIEQALERDIANAWANYQNAIFILDVEESAVETNRENFTRTEEQVKIGRLTSLDFRQAQLNLLGAQTSLNNAKLNAKLAEIQLLALVGDLL